MEIILYFLCVATLFTIFQIYIFKSIKELKNIKRPNSYKNVMNILLETIKTEFEYIYKLEYDLKNKSTDTKTLPNFKNELKRITGKIIHSFSPEFLKDFEQFYTREYLILFVSKNVEIFLLNYIDKNKIKTK